jgi:hypothetical protein
MAQNSVKPFILSNVLSSTITSLYAPLNGTGFIEAPFFIRINNASSMAITVSYDGIHDHEFIPAGTIFDLNSQTNSQPNAQIALFPKFTIIYIKGTAGTGNIYLSGYYV